MNTHDTLTRIVAATLVPGGVAMAGLGLAAGTAHAENWCSSASMVNNVCYGPNQWCPGDSLFHLTQNHVANPIYWDMNACHTYYYVPRGTGNVGQDISEGPNPPGPQALPPRAPYLPPPPGMCWHMWIPGPCPGG